MAYFNAVSYVLSRFAFVGTHVDFALWLLFILNDPFGIAATYINPYLPVPVPTLDVTPAELKPPGTCSSLIVPNLYNNLFFFAIWWGTHSSLARTATKKALGLLDHPIERPLFAAVATVAWLLQILTWRPITNCSRWDPASTSAAVWAVSGGVMVLGTVLIVGLLWTLPDHVFGTSKFQYPQGTFPEHKVIKGTFPYGLVRHPAAAGFLWCYWALPSFTANHILLALLWSVFIIVGTVVFEEKGISDESTAFGREYVKYRRNVHAFYPTWNNLLIVLGLRKYEDDEHAKGNGKSK